MVDSLRFNKDALAKRLLIGKIKKDLAICTAQSFSCPVMISDVSATARGGILDD